MNSHYCQSKAVDDLLSKLPKDVRDMGEEVLHAINCGKKVFGWNANEELTIDGKAVPNTNIVKLVKYILYPEDEKVKVPDGFNTFLEGLKDIGLESEWVRNESVKEELDNNENDWNTTDESDDEEVKDEEEDDSAKSEDESVKNEESDADEGDKENSDSDVEMVEKHSRIEWKDLSSSGED